MTSQEMFISPPACPSIYSLAGAQTKSSSESIADMAGQQARHSVTHKTHSHRVVSPVLDLVRRPFATRKKKPAECKDDRQDRV